MNRTLRDEKPAETPMLLLVGADSEERQALSKELGDRGCKTFEASSSAQALRLLETQPVDGVVAEELLPDLSGVEFLERVLADWPSVPRVLVSDCADPRITNQAINRSRVAYLLARPWQADLVDELIEAVLPAQAAPAATATSDRVRPDFETRPDEIRPPRFPGLIGDSPAMRELTSLIERVAETDSTALVTGETGSGKELVGNAIHAASRRSGQVFCAVNSAAFPETLLESELFGHRRGAFTGAANNSKGLFESADRGTVFLDEVAEMPLSMQAKLLRFLQTGEIRPVGSEATRFVDVRLVTATNKDLEVEVEAGRFREDLYYRLAVIPIHVPPLRDRLEDIPLLVDHFLGLLAEKVSRPVVEIDPDALDVLMSYDWPGNVRQLQNVIERGVALCRGSRIGIEDLPRRFFGRKAKGPGLESLPSMERRHILETLEKVGWNRRRAADILQISTTTLWRRLKEFGIEGDSRGGRAELTPGR